MGFYGRSLTWKQHWAVKEISTPPILREEGGENEQHPLEVGREVTSPKAKRSRIYLGKVRRNALILTCKGYFGQI